VQQHRICFESKNDENNVSWRLVTSHGTISIKCLSSGTRQTTQSATRVTNHPDMAVLPRSLPVKAVADADFLQTWCCYCQQCQSIEGMCKSHICWCTTVSHI